MAGMLGGMQPRHAANNLSRVSPAPASGTKQAWHGGPRLRVAQRAGQDLGQLGPGAPTAEDETPNLNSLDTQLRAHGCAWPSMRYRDLGQLGPRAPNAKVEIPNS